ncbi:hypothetical protein F4806DRAFT_469884 [Annulohypoxylon nitens]|nr:hypothetical protein F4806DRAFT_469884 [Annulohypoxylon nitens]
MMDPLNPTPSQISVEKFLDIPYDQRWERLKPAIVRIYMEENNKLASLSCRMKDEYSFDAQVHQYRYHFKKWGIKKRTVAEEKDAVITALGKRLHQEGASTSDIAITQGDYKKQTDKKQLKRYINQTMRRSEHLTLNPGMFLKYDLPYNAFFRRPSSNHSPSPSFVGPATPSYVDVTSPQGCATPASHTAMSPTTQLIQKKILMDRARLLLDGREQDLLTQLSRDEKESTATWLHDFWIYSFMTAKYWGRGPRVWTPSLINFKSFGGHSIPSSLGGRTDQAQISNSLLPTPTQLCRWSIHYEEGVKYEEIASPSSQSSNEPEDNFDIDDESTWAEWNKEEAPRNLESTIQEGLRQNTFSAVQPENLPFDVNSIVKAVERSSNQSKIDALGFAIMSRNGDAVRNTLYNDEDSFREELTAIYPFHLAASFLDGGKTCCLIMDVLLNILDGSASIGINYTDKSGLTVLDTLFVTIIRSHSAVLPQALGDAFNSQIQYAGQDVDTCGRWDADSPCIRHLHASGEQAIPHQWKHMFCHTSVQAVCHTILLIFGYVWRPNIDTPSGLFSMRCVHCGSQPKVGPLHALVLTAFCLANDGLPGENLFGIIACLVYLLTLRIDPCATAAISIPMLLEHDPQNECQHPEMNPVELASILQRSHNREWTLEVTLGWKMMIAILQQDVTRPRDKYTESDADVCRHPIHEYEEEGGIKLVHCGNERLGMIFACIQAELLTYRRQNEGDPWLSPRFNMEMLLRGMESDDDNDLKILVRDPGGTKESMLQEYSCCGLFKDAKDTLCVRRGEACTSYYANLDDWKRTTFIKPSEC